MKGAEPVLTRAVCIYAEEVEGRRKRKWWWVVMTAVILPRPLNNDFKAFFRI